MTTAIEVNCETGEVIERPLTADEIAANEAAQAQSEADRAKQETIEAAKADAKLSARAKLSALGLTADDLKVLGL